jgi:hypothetical protein
MNNRNEPAPHCGVVNFLANLGISQPIVKPIYNVLDP